MDDLISRSAAIDAHRQAAYWQDAERKIAELPAVDAIPVEWLRKHMDLCHENSAMYQTIDTLIGLWQEEHYPTWEEWLITQGVIKENQNGGVGYPMPKLLEPIPADIAEKLGIRQKEG